MVKRKKDQPKKPGACLFCNSSEDDELKYGKLIFHKKSKMRVHHYCLLFASGLCQRGEGSENNGIEGFLVPDIKEEYKRGNQLRCVYCHQKTATVGCVIKACRSMYHYGCGVENKAIFLFYDNFISYCIKHRPQQSPPELPPEKPTSTCPICLESVEAKVSEETLRTPCCTNSWFHRTCVQRQALSAGYFFRCGICNNKEDFQREMKQFGIYIPEQDASWELEENAYQELYQRHNQCDSQPCICPKGRKYHPSRGKWELVLCDTCGSRGCHLTCGGLSNQWDDWVCDQCSDVMDRINTARYGQGSKSKKASSTKKTSTKKTTPKEARKEKLTGKTPRTPLPSRKPVKKSGKAAPSTCPSLSPPSPSDSIINMSQLSIHLPSVSASPNDGVYLTDSSQCSSTSPPCSMVQSTPCNNGSRKKGSGGNSFRKSLPLSSCKPRNDSPPHFCCTSQDRFAHSHDPIPPNLSLEDKGVSKAQKQHIGFQLKHKSHVCQKYSSSNPSPAVKTTSRMSMRGPATCTPTFKAGTDGYSSLNKAGGKIHHHSLSGVHLCARHRQQIQHSNLASWNRSNSTGSTSSHNSSGSSDETDFDTVHLSPNGKVPSKSLPFSGSLPNGIRKIAGDVTNGKEVVVQLKPLPNLIDPQSRQVLCHTVSLCPENSKSQAILGSTLSSKVKFGNNVNTTFNIKHTCSKRKLENEPSAPRKKFKVGKSPPPKKVENKSPLPRKVMKKTSTTSPQKKAKPSSAKKVNLATPTKKKAKPSIASPSPAKKVNLTKSTTANPSSAKKVNLATATKKKEKSATESISLKKKTANSASKIKAGNPVKSQSVKKDNKSQLVQKKSAAAPSPKKNIKFGNGQVGKPVKVLSSPKKVPAKGVSSPTKAPVKRMSSPKKAQVKQFSSSKAQSSVTPSSNKVLAPVKKKTSTSSPKRAKLSPLTKQSTLEKYLQPLTTTKEQSDSSSPVPRKKVKYGKLPTPKKDAVKLPLSKENTCKTSINAYLENEAVNDSKASSKPSDQLCKPVNKPPDLNLKERVKTVESISSKVHNQLQKSAEKSVQSNPNFLRNLLLGSPIDGTMGAKSKTPAGTEREKRTRSAKPWNARMDSGEIVFSKSPPAGKSPVKLNFKDSPTGSLIGGGICFSFSESELASPIAEMDISKVQKSQAEITITPLKRTSSKPECRLPARSSPRLMKDRTIKVNVAAAAVNTKETKIWVPSGSQNTVSLASVSEPESTERAVKKSGASVQTNVSNTVEKSHIGNKQKSENSAWKRTEKEQRSYQEKSQNSALDSNGEKKAPKLRMEIMYPDGSHTHKSKDLRHLNRILPKKTAMSQDKCFLEIQEFNKTMMATAADAMETMSSVTNINSHTTDRPAVFKNSHLKEEYLFTDDENTSRPEIDYKTSQKTHKQTDQISQESSASETQESEDDDGSDASSSDDTGGNLVRRSSRFESGTPSKGGKLVRRSSRRDGSRRILPAYTTLGKKNRRPCPQCRAMKKGCTHWFTEQKQNGQNKSTISDSSDTENGKLLTQEVNLATVDLPGITNVKSSPQVVKLAVTDSLGTTSMQSAQQVAKSTMSDSSDDASIQSTNQEAKSSTADLLDTGNMKSLQQAPELTIPDSPKPALVKSSQQASKLTSTDSPQRMAKLKVLQALQASQEAMEKKRMRFECLDRKRNSMGQFLKFPDDHVKQKSKLASTIVQHNGDDKQADVYPNVKSGDDGNHHNQDKSDLVLEELLEEILFAGNQELDAAPDNRKDEGDKQMEVGEPSTCEVEKADNYYSVIQAPIKDEDVSKVVESTKEDEKTCSSERDNTEREQGGEQVSTKQSEGNEQLMKLEKASQILQSLESSEALTQPAENVNASMLPSLNGQRSMQPSQILGLNDSKLSQSDQTSANSVESVQEPKQPREDVQPSKQHIESCQTADQPGESGQSSKRPSITTQPDECKAAKQAGEEDQFKQPFESNEGTEQPSVSVQVSEQQDELTDSDSTPSSSPTKPTLSPYKCKKKHKHQSSCKRKHVHYPVCDSPHLHGPRAKQRKQKNRPKTIRPPPSHVHKPKCLAPHLHGPQPNKSPDLNLGEESCPTEMEVNKTEEHTNRENNEVSQSVETNQEK